MFAGLKSAMPRPVCSGRAACSCDRGCAARRADFLQAPCLSAAAPLALWPPAATAPEYMQGRAGRPETGEAGGGEAGREPEAGGGGVARPPGLQSIRAKQDPSGHGRQKEPP